jgi:hypothetical protein
MQNIRRLIQARQEKIREMEKNFEDHRRIARYKQDSLQVIREDYLKSVKELQAKNQAQMDAIAGEYAKKRPSVREQSEHLTVLRTQYRASTPMQLERASEILMSGPPGIFAIEDYHSLAAELRNRGMIERADHLASYCEIQHVSQPYIHTDQYRELERVGERLKVFAAQSNELLILSNDPNVIGQDDVVSLDHLDDGQVTS